MTENNKKSTETKSKIKLLLKIKEKENGTSETPFHKTDQNYNLLFQNKLKDIKKITQYEKPQ